jgi:molybdopterin converting factor subunit 1
VRIEVLYFASAREAAGCSSETLEVPDAATLRDLRPLLSRRHPALAAGFEKTRFAVGERFVADDASRLSPGDRVALIPPVSGG